MLFGPRQFSSVVRFDVVEVWCVMVVLFHVRRTCVANLNFFVCYGVLPICSTGVDSVDVIYAAANGVLLDDSDAHLGIGG
jgi:hypothetical protein